MTKRGVTIRLLKQEEPKPIRNFSLHNKTYRQVHLFEVEVAGIRMRMFRIAQSTTEPHKVVVLSAEGQPLDKIEFFACAVCLPKEITRAIIDEAKEMMRE